MDSRDLALPVHASELGQEAIATVRRWLGSTSSAATPANETHLSALLSDVDGLSFATGFVDGVLRPGDMRVAGHNLERLSRAVPASVRWYSGIGTQLAGGFAPILPSPIVPIVREGFLKTVGHLLIRLDAHDLGKQLAELIAPGGIRPTVAPITAPPSGRREADRQLADARELLLRPDVGALSISLLSVLGSARLLDLDSEVESAVDRLAPLFELASTAGGAKLITFEVQRVGELELTVRVFQKLCELYGNLEAGITLPAYLPDSLPALQRIEEWAQARRATGGARVVVRLVKGDFLGEERADAALNGWPLATFATREETDAQFKRMLDFAVTPARSSAVSVIVATHNLFDTAFAWRLARRRGVERWVEYEFMLGIASAQADAVKRDVGGIRLYTPVVQPGQLPLAAPYLVRRLHDLSDQQNFLSSSSGIATNERLFTREEGRFTASVAEAHEPVAPTRRRQDPNHAANTDFVMPANRDWAAGVLVRARDSLAGEDLVARSRLGGLKELQGLVVNAVRAGDEWGERRGSTRAQVLDNVAEVLAEWRGLLVEVAVSESGLTLEEADREVTVAIDLARVAAENARQLEGVVDATFVPARLVVVVSPRSGPIAIPAGAVLAALAAGSAVILKTSPETRRSSAVLVDTLRAGGVPAGLVGIVDDEGAIAQRLISHPNVDRVVLFGSRHTAKLFHSWRAELRLEAATGGRNSIIVTPSADLETAVADVVASAFDHAGQAPTATSLVILVGSVTEDSRFLGRLTDAVSSISVGPVQAGVSALARPAVGGVLEALDSLEAGESWLVRPKQLDEGGRSWSPGLRDGVQAGSAFHTRENRAPVLGIMHAASLAEAIDLQNSLGFGFAAGIQALDGEAIAEWLDKAQAGMLFVNRPIVSGLRSRLPFGGWERSSVGSGWKSGGPNELVALGDWAPVFSEPGTTVTLEGISEPVAALIEAAQPGMNFLEFDRVRAGAQSDEREWQNEFSSWRELGRPELSGLGVERNVFRYRPLPVTIRLAEGADPSQLVRVLAAATLAQSAVAVSTAIPLHDGLISLFGRRNSHSAVAEVVIESDARWHARVQAGGAETSRIRLIGGDPLVLARVLHGQPGVAIFAEPVTSYGRIELLPFLREQSISVTANRHGYPDPVIAALPLA